VPVEFLSDEQAEVYGQFIGEPSRAELERFFFLDDADLRRTMAAITSLTTRTSASSMPPAPLAGKARRPSLNSPESVQIRTCRAATPSPSRQAMDSAPSATSPNHSKRNTSPMEPPELFPSAVPVATARVRPMGAVGFNWLLSALAAVPQSRAVAAVLRWPAAPGVGVQLRAC